ncbi:MAG TPA: serine/threonine-protein kinase, partial [Thermopolyspora sp.]
MHPLEPDDPPQVAAYSIQERLAEGPHGVAYLARTADDAPVCVIKLLPAGTEPEIVERLAPARRVSNSFVARVLDIGMHDDRPYVVREYIQGRSLAEAVAADGPLSEDALERVAVGVLTGLTAIHLAGLAHRGLSPHNVILAVDGPRITDIDLGEVAGEVGYRSPEQLDSLRHGPSADLFSWAATIVFAATGKAPFGHDREMVLRGKPDIGALEQPLRRVVLSALAKEAARRPTAQTALLQLLGDKSADTKVMGPAPSPVPLPGAPAPIQGVPVPPVPPAS